MRKIQAFGLAFLLAVFSMGIYIYGLNRVVSSYYHVSDNRIRYNFEFSKYKGREILTSNMDDQTLVVLGSSELGKASDQPFHYKQLFNYDDFHIMAIGGGNFQNIIQASILGSIGNDFPKQKFVLSESFIWFDQYGMDPKAFLSRISNEHVYYTLINPKLSRETKEKFMKRVLELSASNQAMHTNFLRYKSALLDKKGNIWDDLLIQWDVAKFTLNNKVTFRLSNSAKPLASSGEKTPDYQWEALMESFVQQAKKQTSNNDFYIENDYYHRTIEPHLDQLSQYALHYRYDQSSEYQDYELVLQMAKEMGLAVEVVSFPVNGKWYDYIGIDQQKRLAYSNRLKEITQSYGYPLIDLMPKAYEPYMMYDTVHPGWKGWPIIEKEIYRFYQEDK